ncbi:histidine phosphatase family protein [Bizionia saleffrena]|uniref:Histidine phosphatase family protein n=1 Tax=Bizionia saleffrena TaxID=291189 RepID=A0A8H2QDL1_9FLAO|nr:histidine phosphatase family protein [Bizionia saleffrena]TYB70052.1 histidine phosphatase family protein [Bizionia saleffrena]
MNNVKILILIRHSKSLWRHNVSDMQRPLKKRGINDANLVSNSLKDGASTPDVILCSPSKRTQETAQIFIDNLGFNIVDFKLIDNLYDFSGHEVIEVIKSCDDILNTIMVFGHNNALTAIANNFGNEYIANVPTSGFLEIHFETSSWKNLTMGQTKKIVFPKHLK